MDSHTTVPRKPLRLWPGVVAAIVTVLLRFVAPLVLPDLEIYAVLAGVAGTVVIVIWWLFFSRAPWSERIGAIIVMVVAAWATKFIVHPSIAGGLMGRMLPVFLLPGTVGPAFVAWAVATRRLPDGVRRATMVATIVLACGFWALVRTDGIKGGAGAQLTWRWTPTAEERLLAQERDEPLAERPGSAVPSTSPAPAAIPEKPAVSTPEKAVAPTPEKAAAPKAAEETPAPATAPAAAKLRGDWPGFRGASRDAVIRGVRIETDWSRTPPAQLWRRPIGPGWSSFAVHRDLFYTQEQRGDDEIVSAYSLSTGQPVWRHRDSVRFYESNGGPGPRGTPTVHNGRVYTLGATGIVNALDAANGAVAWTRNAQTDTGAPLPGWGFTASPLVVDDAVVVAASGRLAAYDIATGNQRWTRTTGGGGYSSPHLVTIDGIKQVLLLSGGGVTSVAPADGSVLWQHVWQKDVIGIVQPALAADGNLLITVADAMGGQGMARVAVAHGPSGWTVEERWTTRGLKPYYNDFVVHKGYAFGFDGSILACIDLADGTRKWKGGRFGNGQLVLLHDQDLLLVLSEEGELALVSATPDKFTEIARFKAIEGKTWNHPVLVGDTLLVRNGEEMAAFRLSVASR